MTPNNIYSGLISIDETKERVLRDRFLTPREKQDILDALTGHSKPMLTTGDVVRGAAYSGLGRLAAKYIGTVIGGTSGLKPETMNHLQNVGGYAGMLRGVGIWR